jgi:ATP-dependent RNA helicase RhlE
MSLVCVDELKLLKDIERLIKRDINKVVINSFEPDLSIKPQPIQNGRGKQQPAANKRTTKPAGRNSKPAWNKQPSSFKGRGNNQSRSGQRARHSGQDAR